MGGFILSPDQEDFLRGIELLRGSPQTFRERLADELQVVKVSQGDEVFADEAPGDAIYFISAGSIEIKKRGRTLFTRHRGECVGEMALLEDAPRSAAAVAETDAVLLRWSKEDFLSTLGSNGEFTYQLCRTLSTRLREDILSVTLIQQERHRAAQLQKAMLPEPTLVNDLVDLSVYCLQADDVGGDYFDYLPVGKTRLGLILADAQGHGFSAALLVAILKTRLNGITEREPAAVIEAMNRAILENLTEVITATCCYVLLDSKRHELHFAGAGHITQYLLRADGRTLEELKSQNFVLGALGPMEYVASSEIHSWAPGDLLVLATDGVTEATNSAKDEFGAERLKQAILRHGQKEPREIRRAVVAELKQFTEDEPYADDVTLVVARLL